LTPAPTVAEQEKQLTAYLKQVRGAIEQTIRP
jgi:hypothetical protein